MDNIRDLYIHANEPVIQSHDYQVLCLLLNVSFELSTFLTYQYYRIDVKWGFDDQNLTLMEEIVMKLAKLNGIDPRKKKQGRSLLRKQIEVFLERILIKNDYKLADVEIDLDIEGANGP